MACVPKKPSIIILIIELTIALDFIGEVLKPGASILNSKASHIRYHFIMVSGHSANFWAEKY